MRSIGCHSSSSSLFLDESFIRITNLHSAPNITIGIIHDDHDQQRTHFFSRRAYPSLHTQHAGSSYPTEQFCEENPSTKIHDSSFIHFIDSVVLVTLSMFPELSLQPFLRFNTPPEQSKFFTHGSHTVLPVRENWPAMQLSHPVDPACCALKPFGQSKQTCDLLLLVRPAGQDMHVGALSVLFVYVPSTHWEHAASPLLLANPSGHAVQLVDLLRVKNPAGHSRHSEEPAFLFVNLPSAHGRQASLSSVADDKPRGQVTHSYAPLCVPAGHF